MISERTLKKWRREALQGPPQLTTPELDMQFCYRRINELSERILKLTQELMDIHLLRRLK